MSSVHRLPLPAATGEPTEVQRLREENALLKALLAQHGIPWEQGPAYTSRAQTPEATEATRSPAAKVALFRHLFRGRTDVYPVRWESAKGRSG
jgi:hypothetical protein